jgi:hypothetical protein
MTDMQTAMADFTARQAERAARTDAQLQRLKRGVIPPLRQAGIATVEVRFDGYGDSGAVEAILCLDIARQALACPEVALESIPSGDPGAAGEASPDSLREALEALAYLALERHHPGWENNDGAGGELVIDVADASFMLECSLRYTAHEDHSTKL